jgi:hypothetical protein
MIGMENLRLLTGIKIVGRYFLDFNEGALKDQREHHWDNSDEELLDPLPHIDN